jgi:hypothetical protein
MPKQPIPLHTLPSGKLVYLDTQIAGYCFLRDPYELISAANKKTQYLGSHYLCIEKKVFPNLISLRASVYVFTIPGLFIFLKYFTRKTADIQQLTMQVVADAFANNLADELFELDRQISAQLKQDRKNGKTKNVA